jgi:hypothetical protein
MNYLRRDPYILFDWGMAMIVALTIASCAHS